MPNKSLHRVFNGGVIFVTIKNHRACSTIPLISNPQVDEVESFKEGLSKVKIGDKILLHR